MEGSNYEAESPSIKEKASSEALLDSKLREAGLCQLRQQTATATRARDERGLASPEMTHNDLKMAKVALQLDYVWKQDTTAAAQLPQPLRKTAEHGYDHDEVRHGNPPPERSNEDEE